MSTANMLTTLQPYTQQNSTSQGHALSFGNQNCVFLPTRPNTTFHEGCTTGLGGNISTVFLPSADGSPVRQLKRLHPGATNTATEMLRCKRRIEFAAQLGYGIPNRHTSSVARRNERERNRVRLVNLGFTTLRQHVPCAGRTKKMSKVDTLKAAVDYINHLRQVLDEHDAVESAFSDGSLPALSPAASSVDGACSPEYASDTSTGTDNMLVEEDELVDFASWFD